MDQTVGAVWGNNGCVLQIHTKHKNTLYGQTTVLMLNPALTVYYPLGFKKLIISFTLRDCQKGEVSTQNFFISQYH